MDTMNQIIVALERDRREPDKILCHIQSLRRLTHDLKQDLIANNNESAWAALYIKEQ